MDLNPSVALIIRFSFAMIANLNHWFVPVLNLFGVQRQRAPAFAFSRAERATIGGRFIPC